MPTRLCSVPLLLIALALPSWSSAAREVPFLRDLLIIADTHKAVGPLILRRPLMADAPAAAGIRLEFGLRGVVDPGKAMTPYRLAAVRALVAPEKSAQLEALSAMLIGMPAPGRLVQALGWANRQFAAPDAPAAGAARQMLTRLQSPRGLSNLAQVIVRGPGGKSAATAVRAAARRLVVDGLAAGGRLEWELHHIAFSMSVRVRAGDQPELLIEAVQWARKGWAFERDHEKMVYLLQRAALLGHEEPALLALVARRLPDGRFAELGRRAERDAENGVPILISPGPPEADLVKVMMPWDFHP